MISLLFIILLLVTIAVATTFIFVSWEGLGHVNSVVIGNEQARVMIFNETLLALSATDLSNERTDSDLTELLTGKFQRLRDEYWLWCIGLGVSLKSTEFDTFMVNVRKDLVNWSDRRRLDANGQQSLTPLFLNSPNHRHYASCAVVGNSGILLQSEYGRLIDSHEAVIRLKNAKVNGFEKHVGSKTTISFINSNIFKQCVWGGSCNCNPYATNTTLITYICQPMHLLDIAFCNHTSTTRPTLLVTDPKFDSQCAQLVKYYSLKRWVQNEGKTIDEWPSAHEGMLFHYSSGFQAVMLALRICDKISLFGFGTGNSTSIKHHYHTQQKSELRIHDYDAEYDIYRDLVRSPGNVPFIAKEFQVPPVVWYQE